MRGGWEDRIIMTWGGGEPQPAFAAGGRTHPTGALALNHIAIALPSRESWLRQLTFLKTCGVAFVRRVNHDA
jgi:hypothetical protein